MLSCKTGPMIGIDAVGRFAITCTANWDYFKKVIGVAVNILEKKIKRLIFIPVTAGYVNT